MRDNLGRFLQDAAWNDHRYLILKNGRELGGLVSARELHLLENAKSRSMEFKALQIAEEMMRWRIIREGLEKHRRESEVGE
ncbi:hypothetical protein CFI11_03805 [Thalassococcus sp. S3]|nr:hypothetical protein CFI11_03805 [Thalassococcus sp. S3]